MPLPGVALIHTPVSEIQVQGYRAVYGDLSSTYRSTICRSRPLRQASGRHASRDYAGCRLFGSSWTISLARSVAKVCSREVAVAYPRSVRPAFDNHKVPAHQGRHFFADLAHPNRPCNQTSLTQSLLQAPRRKFSGLSLLDGVLLLAKAQRQITFQIVGRVRQFNVPAPLDELE